MIEGLNGGRGEGGGTLRDRMDVVMDNIILFFTTVLIILSVTID
jgi:hypothetical protein